MKGTTVYISMSAMPSICFRVLLKVGSLPNWMGYTTMKPAMTKNIAYPSHFTILLPRLHPKGTSQITESTRP